jgi:hypothetical protein
MKKEPKITLNEWQLELSKLLPNNNKFKHQFNEKQKQQLIWIMQNNKSVAGFVKWFKKTYGFGSPFFIHKQIKLLRQEGRLPKKS